MTSKIAVCVYDDVLNMVRSSLKTKTKHITKFVACCGAAKLKGVPSQ